MPENTYSSMIYDRIGVIGAGAWGTALASVAAKAGRSVVLWAREPDVADSITRTRVNARFLSGVALPQNIRATNDLAVATHAEALLIATPAQHLRDTLNLLAQHVADDLPLMLCAKGIESESGLLLTEVLAESLPHAQIAILSGPSFARDLANGLPTAVTIAARMDIAKRLQASLGHGQFRPYVSDDVIAVALGGAAKNVYAIGCGAADGLGLGESARAALLARSFAELTRLGAAIGGRSETFMGLSGLGDLVLSATSPSSRNFAFGQKLGQGQAMRALLAPGMPLVEGAATARPLVARAQKHGVEMPIATTILAVLDGVASPATALNQLMNRPLGRNANSIPEQVSDRLRSSLIAKDMPMLFIVTAIDNENSLALRMATRDAHFAYARQSGCVRLGGPFLDAKGDMAGSMIIFEADDLAAAQRWHANDPYVKAGLFAQSDVRLWKPTFNGCDARF